MAFQTAISIEDALNRIRRGEYAMPAIQRDYVWHQNQVTWLFDSIMRGYPISSFLFWTVRGEDVHGYKFYDFLTDYREDFQIRGNEKKVMASDRFTAILDGQQRLTSLYIGFMGTFAWRVKNGRKYENTESSRPTRRLYLNISQNLDPNDEEDGRIYEFKFIADMDSKVADICEYEGSQWFRVGKILDISGYSALSKFIKDNNLPEFAVENIGRLEGVVRERIINFYLEEESDLHKALNIFIRINTGATQLTFSDILMSIAISYWTRKDPIASFNRLVDDVRNIGFSIDKDFILKTFLFLYSKDIHYKATNFKQQTALQLEEKWDDISECIKEAFRLTKTFGYAEHLPSTRAIIPIVYYLYHRGIWNGFSTSVAYRDDRKVICSWLHKALLRKIFGRSSDAMLIRIRRAFTYDISTPISPDLTHFPADRIKENLGDSMAISDEFLEQLLHTQKDHPDAFPILALLFPHLDYKNNDFHKDHMHPRALVNSFDVSDCQDDDKKYYTDPDWWNSSVNLQMLGSNENQAKQDKPLEDWLNFETTVNGKIRDQIMQSSHIPRDVSLDISNLKDFLLTRKAILLEKLKEILK